MPSKIDLIKGTRLNFIKVFHICSLHLREFRSLIGLSCIAFHLSDSGFRVNWEHILNDRYEITFF